MLMLYLSYFDSEPEKNAFSDFYEKHKYKPLKVALWICGGNKSMAEDAVHNAVLSIIENWGKFSSYSCDKLGGSFVSIVKYKAIDLLREAKRKEYSELDEELAGTPEISSDIGSVLGEKEAYKIILSYVNELPEIYKVVFELRFIQGFSNEEIAAALDIKPGTVAMRLNRAKEKLRGILQKEGVSYGRK